MVVIDHLNCVASNRAEGKQVLNQESNMPIISVLRGFALAALVCAHLACSTAEEDTGVNGPAMPTPDMGPLGCTAGQTMCVDGFESVCGDNGLWLDTGREGDCGGAQDSCADARNRRSYIGCDYWPVDLDNAIEIWQLPPENGQCGDVGGGGYVYQDNLEVCSSGDRIYGLCDVGRACPDGFACSV